MTNAAPPTFAQPAIDLIEPVLEKGKVYPLFDWLRFGLASIVVLDHAGFKFLSILNGELAVEVFLH